MHSKYKGNLLEIEEAMKRAEDIKTLIIDSGEEAGKSVKSMKTKMVWKSALPGKYSDY